MFSTKFFAAVATLVLLIAGVTYVGAQDTGENLDVTNYKNHDQLLAEIGATVTEFGGFFFSRDGETDVLNIYLVSNEADTDKQEEAQNAVEDKFGAVPGVRLNIIKGDYSIAQLSNWYSAMQDDVWANSHVTGTDLAEHRNRIEIGIDGMENRNDILSILTKLEIPHNAVEFQDRGVLVPHQDLQDRANNDEMIGSYQLEGANLQPCSIGFITVRDGTAGLVTAGHCTEALPWEGEENNTAFFQPENNNQNHKIGNELKDGAFSVMPNCPDGHTCRKSDAAFIEFDSGVSYNRGDIANPVATGSIAVRTTSNLKVKYEGGSIYVGKTLHRFGRTKGHRTGDITNTCATVSLGNNRSLLCQYFITIAAAGGDSGALTTNLSDRTMSGSSLSTREAMAM